MRGFTRFLLWVAAIGGAICLLLYLLVFDVWTIPHGPDKGFETSILPALMPEDKILIKRGSIPKFGELARCQNPTASGQWVVGRVFGEPGDKVEVSDRGVTTNGKAVGSTHGCEKMVIPHPVTENLVTMSCSVAETGAWTFSYLNAENGTFLSAGTSSARVEAGRLYLVSDNRLMHQDSRDFGQVDSATCEHIVYRLWGERFTDSSRRFTILW